MLDLRLQVPCQLRFRDGVGSLLRELCDGLGSDLLHQVVSAFNEAFNNIVKHSSLQPDDPITVFVGRDDRAVSVVLRDSGIDYSVAIDRARRTPRVPSSPVEGGMGLPLIFACMDEVRYSVRDQNVLELVRYL